ncbi:MAG: site-2 protease family protein, partial [Planctomycetales bacterium]|nr:site-2 protease family protein [Planctomycetales bacterium]
MGLYLVVGAYLIGATLLGGLSSAGNFAQMAIGLGVVIFVHELGHFLVAKACGVKCEKFYIGFDVPMPKIGPWQIPSSIFKFQYGETLYGLGIIPLGGYVKMLGQDDNPANAEKEAERTRVAKSDASDADDSGSHHQSVTDVNLEPAPLKENVDYDLDPRSYTAKSVPQRMAIISAGVVMNVIFAVVFATIAYRYGVPYTPAVIGGTVPGSPAWQANIQPGFQVLRV